MSEAIIESLELAAESIDDLVPPVYAAYFERCPGSEALMSHIDDIVRGRMLNEVLRLMMQPDFQGETQYLDFEVNNHKLAYSVEPHMYANLLNALQDVVRDAAGSGWTDAHAEAWRAQIANLEAEIQQRL